MGWTVLYVAFGIVALWLLGEVLLQYKARLRWRLVAFVGFLLVVIGVVLPSVPVIAVGAAGFAVGQTFVTLSFRRGSSTGGRRQSEQERHQDRRRSFGASNPRPSFSLDSPMWICLRPAPTSPRLCSTSRIGIVFISSRAMRSSLDCHYPVPRTESLVGEHEGEGGMTVGNGDEMWAKCSGELIWVHVIARRRVL